MLLSLVVSPRWLHPPAQAPAADTVTVTMLHNNDFHGNLEPSGSNPGMARVAKVVNDVRTAVGADNVVLVDAGDKMQGSLLSNLFKGKPTIDLFNFMGYQAATFGNHEFDWGQDGACRIASPRPTFPYVTANIVVNDTGNCATAGWTAPASPALDHHDGRRAGQPGQGRHHRRHHARRRRTSPSPRPPKASASRIRPTSILHYYDAMKAAGADVIVVLSHLGYTDGGYGYGFTVYGDQTLAKKLAAAGKKPNLIIGGHSHTDLAAATMVGHHRRPGALRRPQGRPRRHHRRQGHRRGDGRLAALDRLNPTGAEDPDVKARIATWASDPGTRARSTGSSATRASTSSATTTATPRWARSSTTPSTTT